MVSARRSLSAVCGALALAGCVAAAAPAHVFATTGPTQFLPAPKFKVQNKIELLYRGQYVIKSVAHGARLSGGAMGIEIDDNSGALYGVAQFYGYDKSGYQSTWVGTLYNFRQAKNQQMSIEILAPSGKPVLGRMTVTRAGNGDLSGQIQLPAGTFAITWHKLAG
jgi:hypothetical protein